MMMAGLSIPAVMGEGVLTSHGFLTEDSRWEETAKEAKAPVKS